MTPAEISPRKVRLLSALLLLGTFAAGMIAGAGILRFLRPPPPGGPAGFGQFRELGLDPAQETKARSIFEQHRSELEEVIRGTFPRVKEINAEIEKELRLILTPDQRKRLDLLNANRPAGSPPGPIPLMDGSHPPGPAPRQALDACAGGVDGSPCSFVHEGRAMNGVCHIPPGLGVLACIP